MKRALIIDDTKNIRLLLTKCLEIEGYTVDTASNGKEGLYLAATGEYHLIFLDIKLPVISGTEVLRQLRTKGIQSPVIIITAYPTVKNAADCTQLGAITYLQKPFTMDRIHHVLHELHLDDSPLSPLAEVQQQLDQQAPEKALALLRQALSQEPENGAIYGLLAKTYRQLGNLTLAEKFQKAAALFLEES